MTAARPSVAVRRFTLVAIVVPAVLTLASLVIQLLALPHVPATIAVHWGASGEPDGFSAAWVQLLVTVVVGFGIPLLIGLICLPGLRRGDSGPTYRLMGTVAASLSALMAVLLTWTLVAQRGLEDARDAPSVVPALLWGLAVAIVVGLAAWFFQPKPSTHNVTSARAPEMTLTPGENAAWFATAALGRGATLAIGATCVLLLGTALAVWFSGAPVWVALLVGGMALVVIAMALATMAFRVQADAKGLSVTSLIGVPTFRVPLSDIRSVAVSDVSPLGEFGGYGIRTTVGAFGVVVRRGSAIVVTRTSGRRFVVTVDDATRGAALLEALVQRQAASRG